MKEESKILRGEDWISFNNAEKMIHDTLKKHHRTKAHLRDTYPVLLEATIKSCLLKTSLYQRHYDVKYGDNVVVEMTLYNDDGYRYIRNMEFPIKKWSREYKLKQLGII